MRRGTRMKENNKSVTDKIILYSGIGVVALTIIVFAIFIYSKSLSDDVKQSTMDLEKMAEIAQNASQNETSTQSASSEIGKTVEESEKENTENEEIQTSNATNNSNVVNTSNANTSVVKQQKAETKKEVQVKELNFEKPVEGDIVKEFAKETLVYSETLKEWTTHAGIDIKAEKTTVVKAAEEGIVKTIKNDPRYGLTIIIEHENNFQTIYSNLMTSEFVVEGEKVEKGQSLGTVGNTAIFEIADEPHLHFEIIKDGVQIDPRIYIK